MARALVLCAARASVTTASATQPTQRGTATAEGLSAALMCALSALAAGGIVQLARSCSAAPSPTSSMCLMRVAQSTDEASRRIVAGAGSSTHQRTLCVTTATFACRRRRLSPYWCWGAGVACLVVSRTQCCHNLSDRLMVGTQTMRSSVDSCRHCAPNNA